MFTCHSRFDFALAPACEVGASGKSHNTRTTGILVSTSFHIMYQPVQAACLGSAEATEAAQGIVDGESVPRASEQTTSRVAESCGPEGSTIVSQLNTDTFRTQADSYRRLLILIIV